MGVPINKSDAQLAVGVCANPMPAGYTLGNTSQSQTFSRLQDNTTAPPSPVSPPPVRSNERPSGIYAKRSFGDYSDNLDVELPSPWEVRPGYVIDIISGRWRKRQMMDDLNEKDMANFIERRLTLHYKKQQEERQETCESGYSDTEAEVDKPHRSIPASYVRNRVNGRIGKRILVKRPLVKDKRSIFKLRNQLREQGRQKEGEFGLSEESGEDFTEYKHDTRN